MPDLVSRSFAGGEVSPSVFGRADLVKYQTGLKTCRNFMVRRHGGASNRNGFQYITSQKTHSARGRLIKFVFNADQTYILLFEHFTMRVVQNGVLLTVPNATEWSAATNYVIGDVALSAGVNYYCKLGHTNQLPPNATYWYAMPAGNIYEVPTPFDIAFVQTLYRSQSGDIVTLTHKDIRIYDLSRAGHTTWVFTLVSMAPSIAAPATLTNSGAAGTVTRWVATAVKSETYEESLISPVSGTSATPSSGSPITLTIGLVSGALEYNVYKNEGNGIYGFIGVAGGATFIDNGKVPDYTLTPPAARDPFAASNNRPACSGYLQQRKCYGGLTNNPETVYGSKTGQYSNFSISSPLRTDDAITYPIASKEVNTVRHIIEVMESFILTAGVEWVALGGTDGQLTPGSPGLKPKSYYGSSEVPPMVIGDNILFVQARGSAVRDLNYDATTKGYAGRDLSVFAAHLFDGKTIEHCDYAQIPDSIVWAQLIDGSLVGLTYLRDHEVWGWHRHDTDGAFEDVAVIPEGDQDSVYALVRRTIGGVTKRYLERLAPRLVTNNGLNDHSVALDARFMDSHLTYDGRITGVAMTLSGGAAWLYTEDLTLTCASTQFVAGDVGNAYRLELYTPTYTPEVGHDETVETIILTVTAFTSTTVVTVNANKTVPVAFRTVAISDWARGVNVLSGLDHLEGKAIAILADGHVVTNGIDAPLTVVTAGSFTLDRPYFVIHAGLPYCSDVETLDLEIVGGETLTSKKKRIPLVELHVEHTRGLWVGEDFAHLREHKQRTAGTYDDPIPLLTGKFEVATQASWNKGGRVCIRQRDPLPATILSITPTVQIGG